VTISLKRGATAGERREGGRSLRDATWQEERGGPDRQATVANSDQLPAGTSGADFCLSRGGGEGALPCGSIQLKFERFNSIQIFQNFDRSKNDLSVLRKI
jgi:hypothetical protein